MMNLAENDIVSTTDMDESVDSEYPTMMTVTDNDVVASTDTDDPTVDTDGTEATETVIQGHFMFEHNGIKIYESPIGYLSKTIRPRGESDTKQLTNFLMSAKVVVDKDSGRESYLLNVHCNQNVYRDKVIDIKETTSPSKFKEAAGITEIYITATPNEFTVLLMAIQRRIKHRLLASNVLGLHDDLFLVPTGCVTKDGLVKGKIILVEKMGDKHEQYYAVTMPEQVVWNQVATRFLSTFPSVNHLHKTLLILGWFMGSVLKPVLRTAGYKYPILNPYGTHESGKTSTIVASLKFFGHIDPRSVQLDRTFPIMKLLSMTNALAVFLDEYREALQNAGDIKRALRNNYDGVDDSRGQSSQSLVKYELHAPLIICGEDTPVDAACQDRMVSINMRPKEKNAEAYADLQAISDKHHFVGGYMVWLLNHQEEWQAIIEEAAAIVATFGPFHSERVKTSAVCILFGLLLSIRLMEDLNMEPSFTKTEAGHAISTLANGTQHTVGDHILEMMYNVREKHSKMFGAKESLVEVNSAGRLIGYFKQSNLIDSITKMNANGLTSRSITQKLEENLKSGGYIKGVSKLKDIKGHARRVLEVDLSQLCEEYPGDFELDDFSALLED